MTSPPRPTTVAVIVNFRTADHSIEAVRSLQRSVPSDTAIIVVDNASGDGSLGRIRSAVAGVQLIEEAENRGFSAGCNVGIREALRRGASRVLLLNSDAVVSATAVSEMERLLDGDDQLGIVGPIVISTSPPGHVESFGIAYSRHTGRMRNLDFGKTLSSIERSYRRNVDAVSGCAMLVKRVVFERVGLFDEDYFFGFEDIHFCLSARASGFLTAATGKAIVEHVGQASIGRESVRRIYFATRNHLLLASRSGSSPARLIRWTKTGTILILNVGYVLFSSGTPRIAGLRALARGARDYFTGRFQAEP